MFQKPRSDISVLTVSMFGVSLHSYTELLVNLWKHKLKILVDDGGLECCLNSDIYMC